MLALAVVCTFYGITIGILDLELTLLVNVSKK